MLPTTETADLLENEWYVVRHSGEIPEVALYAALHYLCDDENGPGLTLSVAQHQKLVEAAATRYQEIVLRDLLPANRHGSAYRGVRRAIVNWRRYRRFCRRRQRDYRPFRHEVAATLLLLLAVELADDRQGRPPAAINCSYEELNEFARELGLVDTLLPTEVKSRCLESPFCTADPRTC